MVLSVEVCHSQERLSLGKKTPENALLSTSSHIPQKGIKLNGLGQILKQLEEKKCGLTESASHVLTLPIRSNNRLLLNLILRSLAGGTPTNEFITLPLC